MRTSKYIAKILCILILLLLVGFGSTTYYIYVHQDQLMRYVIDELTGKLNGKLTIEKATPEFFKTFPHACITLQKICLTDSLYAQHKTPLLKAEKVRVTVNMYSLLQRQPQIREVFISHGTIHWYSNGYSNKSVLSIKPNTTRKPLHIRKILIKDIEVVSENRQRKKNIRINASKLSLLMRYSDTGWHATMRFNALVHNMTLNEANGSLLQKQPVSGMLRINGNIVNGSVSIEKQHVALGTHKIGIAARLNAANSPATYAIYVDANEQHYDTLLQWVSPLTASKLKRIGISGKFSVQAHISGIMRYPDTPMITVRWKTTNANLNTPYVHFAECGFSGTYVNGSEKDRNQIVYVYGWHGMWHGIPLRSDTIKISHLKKPCIDAAFNSVFPIEKLRFLANGTSFKPNNGTVNLRIRLHTSLTDTGKLQQLPIVNGQITVRNFGITYLRRNCPLTGISASFVFRNNDLFVQNTDVRAAGTQYILNGQVPGFLSYLFTSPQTLKSKWTVESKSINIGALLPFVASNKKTSIPDTTHDVPIARQLRKFLGEHNMQITLSSPEILYKSFKASMVHGNVFFTDAGIEAKKITLMHSGGSFVVNGFLSPSGATSKYSVSVDARMVDIRRFFEAFNNFGQDAITSNNLDGSLSAGITINGGLDSSGHVMPYSITGTANYQIVDGKLVHFEPILHLGKRIFRSRNLDTISFRHLAGSLAIQRRTILFPTTYIESSALNLEMEGRYVIGGLGTDIALKVPLRNPKKDELVINDAIRHKRNMKGIVLQLRALGTESGSVKMHWNNSKKANE